MEPEILIAIISSITAGISVIATYFFGVLNEKRNFELEYDKKMIEERLDTYKKLWKLFLPLTKYSPPEDTTYSTLKNLSTSMSNGIMKKVVEYSLQLIAEKNILQFKMNLLVH